MEFNKHSFCRYKCPLWAFFFIPFPTTSQIDGKTVRPDPGVEDPSSLFVWFIPCLPCPCRRRYWHKVFLWIFVVVALFEVILSANIEIDFILCCCCFCRFSFVFHCHTLNVLHIYGVSDVENDRHQLKKKQRRKWGGGVETAGRLQRAEEGKRGTESDNRIMALNWSYCNGQTKKKNNKYITLYEIITKYSVISKEREGRERRTQGWQRTKNFRMEFYGRNQWTTMCLIDDILEEKKKKIKKRGTYKATSAHYNPPDPPPHLLPYCTIGRSLVCNTIMRLKNGVFVEHHHFMCDDRFRRHH